MRKVSFSDGLATVQAEVERHLRECNNPRVLDGGCGTSAWLRIPDDVHLTGLDVSREELERNTRPQEKIVGDLQRYPLPAETFDLIICWDVLEHLPEPELAIENMRQALLPGGMLIVASPNVLSLKGLVTKATPFWFHRLYYRLNSPEAHRTGLRPFRTFLRHSMSPGRVVEWASSSSLTVRLYLLYEGPMQIGFRRRFGLTGWMWRAIRAAVRTVTFDRVDLQQTDYILVLISS